MTEKQLRARVIAGLEWIAESHIGVEKKIADEAIALLKQEPTTSTLEAEWHLLNGKEGATCSYCCHTYYDVYDAENYDNYCRHCGARMVKIRTVKWDG